MTARYTLLLLLQCYLAHLGFAQSGIALHHDWAFNTNGTSTDIGRDVITGSDGAVYMTGSFIDTVDFDPSLSSNTLNSFGEEDIFVAKYDSYGNLIWQVSVGGDSTDTPVAIGIDALDNIYITGLYDGAADFDPSSGKKRLYGDGSFLLKLDSDGNFLWVKEIDGTSFNRKVIVSDLVVDRLNNVHVVGMYEADVIIDNEIEVIPFISGTGGIRKAFSLTFDKDGNYVKHYAISCSPSEVWFTSVDVDSGLNQYFGGEFNGTCDFDSGLASYSLTSVGSGDQSFVTKVSGWGSHNWTRTFESPNSSRTVSVKVDGYGNVYTLGTFDGNVDLNPGIAVENNIGSPSTVNAFLSKINAFGIYVWGRTIEGALISPYGKTGNANVTDLYVDSVGTAYVLGWSDGGGIGFDANHSSEDVIVGVADYDQMNYTGIFRSSGTIREVFYVKSNVSCPGYGITVTPTEDVYTTGMLKGICDFRPTGAPYIVQCTNGPSTTWQTSDAFLQKISRVTAPLLPIGQKVSHDDTDNSLVYPNPVSSELTISLVNDAPASIKLFSLDGKIVLESSMNGFERKLCVDALLPGTYILEIIQAGEVFQSKFEKQ